MLSNFLLFSYSYCDILSCGRALSWGYFFIKRGYTPWSKATQGLSARHISHFSLILKVALSVKNGEKIDFREKPPV